MKYGIGLKVWERQDSEENYRMRSFRICIRHRALLSLGQAHRDILLEQARGVLTPHLVYTISHECEPTIRLFRSKFFYISFNISIVDI
jgi:hypothetical protein